jgi:hypothetical protein
MTPSWRSVLLDSGWVCFPRTCVKDTCSKPTDVVSQLDTRGVRITKLAAKTQTDARANTLSSMLGLQEFPPHTDYVIDDLPPQYIVLVAPRPREAKTYIFNSAQLEVEYGLRMKSSLFRVTGTRNSFLTRFITESGPNRFIRFNAAITIPLNRDAIELDKHISAGLNASATINWNLIRFVVIDNWRCLHSRGSIKNIGDPALWRFAV